MRRHLMGLWRAGLLVGLAMGTLMAGMGGGAWGQVATAPVNSTTQITHTDGTRLDTLLKQRAANLAGIEAIRPDTTYQSGETPTVALGSSSSSPTSSITSHVNFRAISSYSPITPNPVFRFRHGTVTADGGGHYEAVQNNVTVVNNYGSVDVEFCWSGTQLEIVCDNGEGSNQYIKVIVDGKVATYQGPLTNSPGNYQLLSLTFADRATRLIRVQVTNGAFAGINVGPADPVWLPYSPLGPRAIIVGDSVTQGAGIWGGSGTQTPNSFGSWATILGQLMGWDAWESGIGGTGYLNPGASGNVNFGARTAHDIISYAPDIVVLAGGINDNTYNYTNSSFPSGSRATDVQSACTSIITSIKTALPRCQIYVAGPWYSGAAGTGDPNYTPNGVVRTGLMAAAAASGVPYIETKDLLTSAAMVAQLRNPDGTHPNAEGHYWFASDVASQIVNAGTTVTLKP